MSNYLISIGGTGAKCVESFVHLCAAGLGPDKLHILMIDADEANGNLDRTNSLIENYNACRESANPDKSRIFTTELVSAAGENKRIWSPLHDINENQQTLNHYLGYAELSDNQRKLCRMMYSDKELNEKLSGGFRGHPNIGAAVVARLKDEFEREPILSMIDAINTDLGAAGETVKVFIVSSIFGGTGAAGFPIVARLLRERFHDKSNLYIGGALLLPYFAFPVPSAEGDRIYARPENFLVNTKAALFHYGEMGPEIKSYDSIYILGENRLARLEKHIPSGRDQKNPSHNIELLAALSAKDFYEAAITRGERQNQYYLPRDDNDMISWDNLPFKTDVKSRLTYFSTVAIASMAFYYPLLKEIDQKNEYVVPWLIDHFSSQESNELMSESKSDSRKSFEKYFCSFLNWIYDIHDFAPYKICLFMKEALESLEKSSYDMISDEHFKGILHISEGLHKHGFDRFWCLSCEAGKGYKTSYNDPEGRLINILYDVSVRFCNSNYNLRR